MTYTDAVHRTAVAQVDAAQTARTDAGLEPLADRRAVESAAPENGGNPRGRTTTLTVRLRLAQSHLRQRTARAATTRTDTR